MSLQSVKQIMVSEYALVKGKSTPDEDLLERIWSIPFCLAVQNADAGKIEGLSIRASKPTK